MKFLLDANLSPETADFLRRLSFDAISLVEMHLGGLNDAAVIRLAERQGRILITFDKDFGEIAYFSVLKRAGVIILRIADQRIETVNTLLNSFLKKCVAEDAAVNLRGKLIILQEGRFGIYQ